MPTAHFHKTVREFTTDEVAELREMLADWREHKQYVAESAGLQPQLPFDEPPVPEADDEPPAPEAEDEAPGG